MPLRVPLKNSARGFILQLYNTNRLLFDSFECEIDKIIDDICNFSTNNSVYLLRLVGKILIHQRILIVL